jgi:hypothetical protein
MAAGSDHPDPGLAVLATPVLGGARHHGRRNHLVIAVQVR